MSLFYNYIPTTELLQNDSERNIGTYVMNKKISYLRIVKELKSRVNFKTFTMIIEDLDIRVLNTYTYISLLILKVRQICNHFKIKCFIVPKVKRK